MYYCCYKCMYGCCGDCGDVMRCCEGVAEIGILYAWGSIIDPGPGNGRGKVPSQST